SLVNKRCSSLSRKVSCTFLPAISIYVLQLAGASGSMGTTGADCVGISTVGVTGSVVGASTGGITVSDCPCGCSLAGFVGPLLPFWSCSSFDLARARARLANPAAMRCLHQFDGALG